MKDEIEELQETRLRHCWDGRRWERLMSITKRQTACETLDAVLMSLDLTPWEGFGALDEYLIPLVPKLKAGSN